jgi:ATP-dependent DNA helicase RecG
VETGPVSCYKARGESIVQIPDIKPLLTTETDRVEWKESSRDADKILQATCALANDLGNSEQPGYLLIGVDKRGSVKGIDASGTGIDEELRILSDREYDAEKEVDPEPESFRPFEGWLTHRQMGEVVTDVWCPNYAAILVYGRDPQNVLPGAYIDFIRYKGTDVDAEIVARKPATGALPNQLDILWSQLEAHNAIAPTGDEGVKSQFASEYPAAALKELARNLAQHRAYEGTNAPSRVEWYDDRVEFSNPGAPFGRASEGQFGEHSDYRNPVITAALASLGYVEAAGRGIRRVRLQLQRAGHLTLEVSTNGFTRLIVRRHS